MSEQKTNVMRILEQKKIKYAAHEYPHGSEAVDGVSVAALIGVDPAKIFKTLITRGASKTVYVFVFVSSFLGQYIHECLFYNLIKLRII